MKYEHNYLANALKPAPANDLRRILFQNQKDKNKMACAVLGIKKSRQSQKQESSFESIRAKPKKPRRRGNRFMLQIVRSLPPVNPNYFEFDKTISIANTETPNPVPLPLAP